VGANVLERLTYNDLESRPRELVAVDINNAIGLQHLPQFRPRLSEFDDTV
jgi:hypothetical protein